MLGGADNPNGELPSYITGADMVYTEKHIRIISVTTAAAIHPVIGSSENDVQLRTRHPETTAD